MTVVDYQAHWYPRSHAESLPEDGPLPRAETRPDGTVVYEALNGDPWSVPPGYFDLDAFLEGMREHEITTSVISPNMFAQVGAFEIARAREIIEELNEATARAQREHPKELIGLAMLPMQDTGAAVETLDRAIGELGLKGVCVLSNIDGRPIAGDETAPIYARIAELGVPLFLHPSHNSICYDRLASPVIDVGLAWMFDTAAAALSLIQSGTLDRHPDLTVVHPHLGGVLPYAVGRVEEVSGIGPKIEQPVRAYLRRQFFVDCVSSTPAAIGAALDLYGEDRVLFATDYPWIERKLAREYLESNLSPELATRVREGNQLPGFALP